MSFQWKGCLPCSSCQPCQFQKKSFKRNWLSCRWTSPTKRKLRRKFKTLKRNKTSRSHRLRCLKTCKRWILWTAKSKTSLSFILKRHLSCWARLISLFKSSKIWFNRSMKSSRRRTTHLKDCHSDSWARGITKVWMALKTFQVCSSNSCPKKPSLRHKISFKSSKHSKIRCQKKRKQTRPPRKTTSLQK